MRSATSRPRAGTAAICPYSQPTWSRARPLGAAQKAGQAAARGVELGCLARLLRAFGGKDDAQGAGRDAAAVPGLAEQLTARELEVLVLLAAGMPNPRIAEQLVVTLDTVKKHVSHLLG